MLWKSGRRSTNIEDRRGMRVGPALAGGGLGSIVLVIVALFFGVDPGILTNSGGFETDVSQPSASAPIDDETKDFVSAVVAYTEDTWSGLFQAAGRTYQPPRMVLFTGAVESACGYGQSAMGPFYCPGDHAIYLDSSFFQELRDRFEAPGDFAQAYVIAHEVGHHVQNLLGISGQVEQVQRSAGRAEANDASVRLELQADCLAGIWANHTQGREQFLEAGDLEEALRAASSIGDDKLQMEAQGYVVPESFTHGTAEQRMRWFKGGFDSGNMETCNTFN